MRLKGTMILLCALVSASGCGEQDCDDYAKTVCELACDCTPNDPVCYLVWRSQAYNFPSRAECERTMGGICSSEDGFDVGSCLEMVNEMECTGPTYVHPSCQL